MFHSTTLRNTLLVWGVLLTFPAAARQPLSAPEREFLRLVGSDTASYTVCYLPHAYRFGLESNDFNRLVMVKSGRRVYFLQDGSHRVYLFEGSEPGWRLRRIDSSVHTGDNYQMMAFMRKDTLYEYGGYGFWQTRDFFTRFHARTGGWEFLTGGQGLPNELSYHYYDPRDDRFYILGSISSLHHPQSHKQYRDSAYRYDFATRRWESLGAIRLTIFEARNLGPQYVSLTPTPFGMIFGHTGELDLIDIRGNRFCVLREEAADRFRTYDAMNYKYPHDFTLSVYLSDTLHILHGDRDEAMHLRVRLTLQDFDTTHASEIYTAAPAALPPAGRGVWMALLSGISLVGLTAYWVWRKSSRQRESPEPSSSPDVPDAIPEPGPSGSDKGVAYFLDSLAASDRKMLEELVRCSRGGLAMDSAAMNRTLGVSNRDAVTQKSRRSSCLARINQAWLQVMKRQDPLVVRERDELDKRAFRYRISQSQLRQLEGFL